MKGPYFPAVNVIPLEKTDGLYRATVGIEVTSIQCPELTKRNSDSRADIYNAHRAIMEAVAIWPENVTIFFNLVSCPDIAYPMRGRIRQNIFLSVEADDRKAAMADVLSRYEVLWALLNNYLAEVEFKAVTDDEALGKALVPIAVNHAVSIERDRGRLSTALPAVQEPGLPIGFIMHEPAQSAEQGPIPPTEIHHVFPWNPALADMSEIVDALLWHPSPFWFHARFRPVSVVSGPVMSCLMEGLRQCEDILRDKRDTQTVLEIQTMALRSSITRRIQQMREPVLRGGVFLCSSVEIDEAMISTVARTISPRTIGSTPEGGFAGGYATRVIDPGFVLDFGCFPDDWPFTPEEAACAFRIPHPLQSNGKGLPLKRFRTALAEPSDRDVAGDEVVCLGLSVHRGYEQPVMLDSDDRMRHLCVLGQTGTGKSTLFENLIIQDIRAGRGLCLLDPHGELVEAVLNRFPRRRKDDLIIIDFTDHAYPVAMNILSWKDVNERDFIIDELYAIIDMEYDMRQAGGPVFEQYMRGMLRLLMGDKPRRGFTPTILEFPRVFRDEKFRRFLKQDITDKQILIFLEQAEDVQGENRLENMAPYVTSKFNRFALDTTLRRMVGQEGMAIDFQDIMDSGKVVLVNLGKGRFGASVCAILCSQLVSRFKRAAMARAKRRPEERRDFYMYVDEFQNIANANFSELLSEARKYRLGLNLANQYADQLTKRNEGSGDNLLSAMIGNVGTFVVFRLGIKDSAELQQVYSPAFGMTDLANLPNYSSYVRMNTGGSMPSVFSMRNLYKETRPNPRAVECFREQSRKQYAHKADMVEKKIREREERINKLILN